MIDLEQYKSRIGQFCPKSKNKKFLYKRYFSHENTYNENCGKHELSSMQFVVKMTMLLVRPGYNSWLSGILISQWRIFCETP